MEPAPQSPKTAPSQEKIRLCFIITRMIAGGAQKILLDLLEGLDPTLYELHLISGTETGSEGSYWHHAQKLLPASQIHSCPFLVRRVQPLLDLRAFFAIRKLLKALNPQVVHTHTSKAGIVGRLAAISLKIPTIIHSTHGLIYSSEANIPGVSGKKLLMKFFLALDRYTGHRSQKVITLSDAEVGEHLKMSICPSKTVCCIKNGVPLQDYAKIQRTETDRYGEVIHVGTAGRLNSEKGHDLLIRMLPRILKKYPSVMLNIAGVGPLEQDLRILAKNLEVENHVLFHGYQKNVPAFMAKLDIFALASHYEGFGLVLVEAMAAGLPVIATQVGGVSEVVKDGLTGLLVPPDSAVDLGLALEYFLDNPQLAYSYGQAGRRRALNLFSLKHMVELHSDLYTQANKKKESVKYACVDLHIRSVHSTDSKLKLKHLIAKAQEQGLKAIAVTDSATLDGAREAQELAPPELMVISGMVLPTDAGDLIGLFVHTPIHATNFRQVASEIRAQGGLVYLPYPFRHRSSISLDLLKEIDIFEICNGHDTTPEQANNDAHNLVAFALEHGKTGIGASDARRVSEVGRVTTCLPPFSTQEELKILLKKGCIYPVRCGSEILESTR